LSLDLKDDSDEGCDDDVTSGCRLFHVFAAATALLHLQLNDLTDDFNNMLSSDFQRSIKRISTNFHSRPI